MQFRLLRLSLLLFGLVFLGSYQISASPPSHVTLDTTKIDSVFVDYDKQDSPGCALGIIYEGELIYANGYGMASLDYGIPHCKDTRFMIASISKQFAAAALILLEERGELDLDEDLRTYIPELPEFESPITARQLIHHTSGLRDFFNLLYIDGRGLNPKLDDEALMRMIQNQRHLNFEPGSRHIYSNTGYFLMSVLVKNITGQTLRDFTTENLFEPSGMKHTHFHDDAGEIVPNRSMSYFSSSGEYGEFYRGNLERVGARGLFTTIEDFAKWDRNFYDNQTPIPDFEQQMSERGTTNNNNRLDYATGLRTGDYKALETIGHGGNYMGFRSNYIRFPEYKTSVVAFCNLSSISPATYTRQVADIILAEVFEEKFAPYEGTYQNENFGTTYRLEVKDGDLEIDRRDAPTGRLIWEDEDEFSLNSWDFKFEKNDDGEYDRFYLKTDGVKKLTFKRIDDHDE